MEAGLREEIEITLEEEKRQLALKGKGLEEREEENESKSKVDITRRLLTMMPLHGLYTKFFPLFSGKRSKKKYGIIWEFFPT